MRHSLRFWRRHPGEAGWLIAVMAMATAIAISTCAIAQAVWFEQLPVRNGRDLVAVGWSAVDGSAQFSTSTDEFVDIKARAAGFLDVAGWEAPALMFLDTGAGVQPLTTLLTTSNFLDVLGMPVAAGRAFDAHDADAYTTVPAGIISERLRRRSFGAGSDVIGRELRVVSTRGVQTVRIVGVLPAGAEIPVKLLGDPKPADLLISIPDGRHVGGAQSRRVFERNVVGRLRDRVSAADAALQLTPILRAIDTEFPSSPRERAGAIVSLHELWFGRSKPFLWLLAAASILAILATAANAAGVMAAIGARRAREIAIRRAIGAGRGRLIIDGLLEMATLASVSWVVAIGLAWVGVRVFVAMAPTSIPRLDAAGLTPGAVFIAGAIALCVAALLAIRPHLRRGMTDVVALLQGGGQSITPSRRARVGRRISLAIQAAIVLALVASAALLAQTLRHMLNQPMGFSSEHVLVASVTPTKPYFSEPGRFQQMLDDLRLAVERAPGRRTVALAFDAPLAEYTSTVAVTKEDGTRVGVAETLVGDGYFKALSIPFLAGRDFSANAGDEMIVDVRYATRQFGSPAQAIGRRVISGATYTIVGVVDTVRSADVTAPFRATVYPFFNALHRTPGRFHIVTRESGDDAAALSAVESAIRASDPTIAVDVSRLSERLTRQTALPRTQAGVLGLLAVFALGLASLGIYAAVSQAVAERTREMGIRASLGATSRSLVVLIGKGAIAPVIAGAIGGCGLSVIVARVVRQFLFGIEPYDFRVWAAAACLLVATALIAAWWPAQRAGRVDPSVVLRSGAN